MQRTHAIWIHSSALPPAPSGGTSLAFANDLILPFTDLGAAQDCAQELVAVL
ncbi:MAG: hypothetical protein HY741_17440, partial [Chloroflexi bacterium]|nr:hypothetical protein [Chloroflexota bacterium]